MSRAGHCDGEVGQERSRVTREIAKSSSAIVVLYDL